jgi:uroporphyrin-III C-methyltransferase/precorrin-2 dehydrogenase/sirohydrochlorin ferrochelatase
MLPEPGVDFASPSHVEAERNAASEAALEAIAPLANLPLFFKLTGRKAVVAGGSEAAAWKAELLAAAGAAVAVFAADPSEKMLDVTARLREVRIERRGWRPEDLADAAIAVGDFADPAESAAFKAAGRAAGAPVNVVDQPEFCDFSFGAIVNRSPLVIGVSTDGAAPVFGQALRGRLEALIPQGFAAWAAAAMRWRERVAGANFRRRRAFWERFAALALANADRPPNDEERLSMFAAAGDEMSAQTAGEAIIIGGGSGGAEFMTLKAWRALQSAEAIVFDDGVSPDCLDLARREARRIKARGGADMVATMVALCREGKTVVRLKSGDVGPADGETAALRAAGISCLIVPGVASPAGSASERRS